MRQPVIGLLAGLALVTGVAGAAPAAAAAMAYQTATVTVSVPATAAGASWTGGGTPWVATGFVLKAGLPVTVSVRGAVNYGCDCALVGPSGTGYDAAVNWFEFQFVKLPDLSVVGRIGTSGKPFFVGAGPIQLTGSGQLYLGYNDSYYPDNSGNFTATIAYTCQPGAGFGDQNHYHCGGSSLP